MSYVFDFNITFIVIHNLFPWIEPRIWYQPENKDTGASGDLLPAGYYILFVIAIYKGSCGMSLPIFCQHLNLPLTQGDNKLVLQSSQLSERCHLMHRICLRATVQPSSTYTERIQYVRSHHNTSEFQDYNVTKRLFAHRFTSGTKPVNSMTDQQAPSCNCGSNFMDLGVAHIFCLQWENQACLTSHLLYSLTNSH